MRGLAALVLTEVTAMSAFRLVPILGVVAVLATGVVTGQSGTPNTNQPGRAQQAAGPIPAAQLEPRSDHAGDPLPDGAIGRLGSTRLRHGAFIRAAAFLPDG